MLRQRALRLGSAVPHLRAARRACSCKCGAPHDAHRRPPTARALSTDSTSTAPAGPAEPDRGLPDFTNHPALPDITNLLDQNEKWAESEQAWFAEHGGKKQAPKYLWVGCSDSRVPAELMVGSQPGEIFVHRNIANMVVNSDMNFASVLQYAVNVLRVPHIIVCGHYDCGGIKAAMSSTHLDAGLGSPIEDWLRNVRDVTRLHADELRAISDPELKHRRLVELNVMEQCLNIFKTGVVQRRRHLSSQVARGRRHDIAAPPRVATELARAVAGGRRVRPTARARRGIRSAHGQVNEAAD